MTFRLILLGAGCLLVLAPAAGAHNAALAAEHYVRFLSDCSDDWGGHSAVRDGHDLVALDLTERWLPEHREAGLFVMLTVGFGFAQSGSQGGPLRDDVELGLPGGTVRIRLQTMDNQKFTAEQGTGLRVPDVLLPPRPSLLPSGQQDGSRILIEFAFRYSSLGMQEGDRVTSAKVQAYARGDRGDMMPGGYYLLGVASGAERECPQSGHQGSGDPGTLYVRRDYQLRGVEAPFLGLRANTDGVAVAGNQTGHFTLAVENRLSKHAQTMRASAPAPHGWQVVVTPSSQSVAAGSTAEFQVRVNAGTTAPNSTLTIEVETDQGGFATHAVPLYWYPHGQSATLPQTSTPARSPSDDVAVLLCLVGLATFLASQRASRG